MNLTDIAAKQFLNKATIVSKKEITKGVFHLVISGGDLRGLNYIPGHHLRIFVGLGVRSSLKEKVRTYSIWKYEETLGIIHLAVCAHTEGPGSYWIKAATAGQEVYFGGPKGKFTIDQSAKNYYFIGDTSALSHLYALCRSIAPGKNVQGIVYAPKPDMLFPDLNGTKPLRFYEENQDPIGLVLQELEKVPAEFLKDCLVYVGGDGRLCVETLRYLKNKRKMPGRNIKVKPFWMIGKSGLE